ncbi:protein kinase [Devosia sp. ZB163]|uniref:protein kinase domain-containing protein n=1 Tax=Devosia sp. ZB163 TaxID=3025938 RepID=UPI00236242C2|nr:protein kinase [Devosia sp. ZB163]MDC9822996.1 protein kinase [Devosia sp. ZB163]
MANEFTIRQGTTAQQIENFLTNDVNQDRKVLARHNKAGEVVLYEKPQPKGLLDKLSAFIDRQLGRTERRESRALDAIQNALGEALNDSPLKLRKALTDRISSAIGHHSQQPQGKTAGFLGGLFMAIRSLPKDTVKVTSESGSPSLQSLGMTPNDKAITDTARLLSLDPEGTGDLQKQLGDAILKKFLAGNPSLVDREGFALSDGIKLTLELRESLRAAIGAMDPAPTIEDGTLDNLVAGAFRRAASQVLPDKIIDQTEQVKWKDQNGKAIERDMPYIELGGKQYKPTAFLGAGGFADVFEYVSVDDANSKIALKVTRELEGANYLKGSQDRQVDDYAKLVKSAGDEITLHQKAYGDGCKQIVGYSGHMRMPDGNFAVAMEIAPNGDVHAMGEKLLKAVEDGQLTLAEANVLRLTLVKDMLRGLDFMHQNQGMTHFDFKTPNCFIGPDGTAKVGDFGLTMKMGETKGLDQVTGQVDNLAFKAPELVRSEDVMQRVKDLAEETGQRLMKPFIEKLQNVLPGGPRKDNLVLAMARNVFSTPLGEIEEQAKSDKSMLFFDRTVDIWGLGSSLLHMFTGKLVGDNKTNYDTRDDLIAFGGNRNSQPLSDPIQVTLTRKGPGPGGIGMVDVTEVVDMPQPGSVGLKTGNDQVDDLLTRMLMPDPRDRWSAGQLLDHPTLGKRGGVDSDEARGMIVALKSGDPQKIAEARRALAGLMPQSSGTTPSTSSTPTPESLTLTMEEVEALTGGDIKMPPLPPTPRG